MVHQNLDQDRQWLPFLKINTGWELGRLALIGWGFVLAAIFTYLTIFSLIHWFSALLLQEVNRSVAVTARDATTEMAKAQAAGFDGFLGKPLNRNRFPDQVRRIFAGEGVWEVYH